MEFLLERDVKSSYFSEYLRSIYEDGISYDATLIVDGTHFKAHQVVLAASSQYFKYLLKEHEDHEIVITLVGFSFDHVKKLLEFIYTGTTTIAVRDEKLFTNVLMQLEIGGTKQALQTDPNTSRECVESTEDMLIDSGEPSSMTEVLKSFRCDVCGQALKTKTGLRMHLLVHQGSKGKMFTCDVCGRGFSQASQLKTHLRIHTGEKPYKCEVCQKSFSHASTLSEHKNLHDSLKPYQCNICKQSFSQRKALRSHSCVENIRDNICQKFICPYCCRPFRTRRGLAIHKMHQHAETSTSDEPILKCHLCSTTFSSELAFETHMDKHPQLNNKL